MPDGPIFVLGLQRGGTNQVLNVLRSHPDTAWPDGEFHEVLRPSRTALRRRPVGSLRALLRYAPMVVRRGDVLSPHRPPGGAALSGRERAWIAAELAAATRANLPEVRRYKRRMEAHGLYPRQGAEAAKARMLVKLVNYNVALAPDLVAAFPSARFVGVVRDAMGTCESMMARGAAPARIVALYRHVGETLIALRDGGAAVQIVRFEELVADVAGTSRRICRHCGLDPDALAGLCLQSKDRELDRRGRLVGTRKLDAFYAFDEVSRHMRRDVNAAARARLPADLRRHVAATCTPVMTRLGYPGDAEP